MNHERYCIHFFILVFFFAGPEELEAQCNPTVKDPPAQPSSADKKPVPYTYLREADVMWSKRVWRTIDLREKINLPLYYPSIPAQGLMSMFDVIKCAVRYGKLTAFANPALDDEFKIALTKSDIESILVQWDSSATTPNPDNPDELFSTPIKTEVMATDIKQYWIKEEWFFDRQRSVMDVRILGICPLKEKKTEMGEVVGYSPLFWIYFPEARVLFAKSPAFNRQNDSAKLTLDEILIKRMFGSYIHKESNVYDRTIVEYKQGLNALLEAERIKEEISNMEHDMWHF